MNQPAGRQLEDFSSRLLARGVLTVWPPVLRFPTIVPASALGRGGRVAPSNRITLGVIGTGNQGFNDINSFLKDERVQIVAVCDVNRESAGYWEGKVGGREPARRLVEKHYAKHKPSGTYRGCDACVDFREILGREDIDAVEICTPDHWHAIPVIEACKARKDIYCQKPLSLTIAEGRAMSYAVSKHRVVFQTGSQQRSDHRFRRACELVRNGRIGDLKTVLVWACRAAAPITPSAETARSQSRSRRASSTTAGSAPRPRPLMPPRDATSTSAGSTTTPAARSPTGAAIIPTVPSGAWAPR